MDEVKTLIFYSLFMFRRWLFVFHLITSLSLSFVFSRFSREEKETFAAGNFKIEIESVKGR